MLDKIKSYTVVFLVGTIIVLGGYTYWQKKSHREEVVKLHNQIALETETVEVTKDAYEKKTMQLDDLEDVLKTFEADKDRDAETIKRLRKLLDKRDEEILTTNRIALRWREAYQSQAIAEEEEIPTNPETPDNPGPTRTKVSFNKDFGYLAVDGYTLTNPAYAWVKVKQNRPLLLTTTVTQAKDGHWSTYVTSSEENVEVDVKLAAVNPYMLEEKWYEKIAIDFGMDVRNSGIFPYTGLSYPIGPISLSAGLWADAANQGLGWYSTINYSWNLFSRR